MGCRFPGGAASPESFWRLLRSGGDAVDEAPPNRWETGDYYHPTLQRPGKMHSRSGAFLEDLEHFDAAFFGISPREASRLDPQQRLLLESAWEALEDAGQVQEELAGSRIGVFVGVSANDYLLRQYSDTRKMNPYTATGGVLSIAANRISHFFDFKGPSQVIDTACSSSLVALHNACQSIWADESMMALVGGVNVILSPETTVAFCQAGIISPSGRCRAFDVKADGFVRGEGAGIVVLKPLSEAAANGDPVYAVILATGVNQDGHTSGLSLPNPQAQEELLGEVCAKAGVSPREVQYLEAHGTGTRVGDPLECRALGNALGLGREKGSYLRIGSVKTNIGHLEPAAGIAGLIKLCLAIKHRQIPPSLHYDTPNPDIPFERLGLEVQTTLGPWPDPSVDVIGGVNSFGFGGTNAHAILKEVRLDDIARSDPRAGQSQLLTLSAKSSDSLEALVAKYRDRLGEDDYSLYDLCFSASIRRSHHSHRLAVVGADRLELQKELGDYLAGEPGSGLSVNHCSPDRPKLAFVFCGNGPQWWAMGRQLLQEEPAFRETLQRCEDVFRALGYGSVLRELQADESESKMDRTDVAQPALLALQLGLVRLWRSWGVQPDAVIGHSVGEVAAAYAAQALTLEDAIRVIHHRSRTQQRTAGKGRMAALGLALEEAEELIAPYAGCLWIAGHNSPRSVTVSGDADALQQLGHSLESRKVFWRELELDYAFHSHSMDPIQEDLLASLQGLRPQEPSIEFISSVTGKPLQSTELGPEYWWDNVRRPVQFKQSVDYLIGQDYRIFVEIGPHPVLSPYLMECLSDRSRKASLLASLRRGKKERESLLSSLGALYTEGLQLHWQGLFPDGRLTALPSYPWQREHHWVQPRFPSHPTGNPFLKKRLEGVHPEWESELDLVTMGSLKDHRIHGVTVFPLAGYIEAGLEIAAEILGSGPCSFEDYVLFKPVILSDNDTPILRFAYSPSDSSMTTYRIPESESDAPILLGRTILSKLEASPPPRIDIEEIRQRCPRELSKGDLYELLRRAGYEFGPSFQSVDRVFLSEREALGEIVVPPELHEEVSSYRFHPLIGDSSGHAILALLNFSETPGEGETFLPVSVKRFILYDCPGHRVFGHARLISRDANTVKADLSILDPSGRLLAKLEGLEYRLSSLGREQSSKDWLYQFQWKPTASSDRVQSFPASLPSGESVAETVRHRAKNIAIRSDDFSSEEEISARMDKLCAAYTISALETLGWNLRPGEGATTQALAERLGVAEERRRQLVHLLESLCEEGILTHVGDSWRVTREPNSRPEQLWKDLAESAPSYHHEISLLGLAGPQLATALKGDLDSEPPLSFKQPTGSMEGLFDTSPSFRFGNQVLQSTLEEVVRRLPSYQTLRILEIQLGIGEVTSWLLPTLPRNRFDYVLSNPSNDALARAQQRFRTDACLNCQSLDIETDPREQGWSLQSFDLIILAHALHQTQRLRATLANVKKLLRSQGMLLVLEPRRQVWFDLVFGLSPDWWDFEDDGIRRDHPMLDSHGWCQSLEEAGFREVSNIFEGSTPSQHSLILAQGPSLSRKSEGIAEVGSQPRRSWIILADQGALGEQLEEQLIQRDQDVVLVHQGPIFKRLGPGRFEISAQERWEGLLAELNPEFQNSPGIVHLWSLDEPILDEDAPFSSDAMSNMGCLSLVRLVQALAQSEWKKLPHLWVVTCGAQSLGPADSPISLSQAPIWGLGRVLMNEHPELRPTLVDLSSGRNGVSSLDLEALLAELDSGEDSEIEQEVLLRQGFRYVHRIARVPLENTAPPDLESSFRLETTRPGLLDNLILKNTQRPEPGPKEIGIEVAAAGLNFKDLMISMGLLPHDALAGGYAGSALGLECAGVVVTLGEDVEGFQVGDEVMAVGRHCFGRHASIPAAFAVKKPRNLSLEEAASVPVAYLTASYALQYLGRLRKGERVLIHGAAGGVGLAAIQIVQYEGGEVFATAGSDEKRSYLRSLGIRHVMDSRSLGFAEEVMGTTQGEGVDLVLNCLSGDFLRKSLGVLGRFGRFLDISRRDMAENSRLDMQPFLNNLSYFAIYLDQLWQGDQSLARSLFDQLKGQLEEGQLRPLPYRVFPVSRVVEAFRYIQQSRHIGKIVISMKVPHCRVTEKVRDQVRFSSDSSYLITGGSRGFGLEVAGWMVERGARHLVLASLTDGAQTDAERSLAGLRSSGAEVQLAQADVGDVQQVNGLLSQIDQMGPPLKGIVHAAAFYEGSILLQLDQAKLRRVMDPKVKGAWNLHRLTRDRPLDFFVLFSSVAAMIGNPGQGSYCAANVFLDALADYRRAQGLPGLAINWGAISDVGYLSRQREIADSLSRLGFSGMSSKLALQVLGRVMMTERSHLGFFRADWASWCKHNGGASSTLSHLVPNQTETQGEGGLSPVESLMAVPPDKRVELLQSRLVDELSKILGVSPSTLDPHQAITEFGLDSLMAVELRRTVEGTLGMHLSLLEILQGQTIAELSRSLLSQLNQPGERGGQSNEEAGAREQSSALVLGQGLGQE